MLACKHTQSITPCRKMHARAYCVVHTPMCVCNSNGCFPVCQSSGSGDDITAQDGSGGRGGEGGAWHGVGRPPSSLSHGSLQKRAAAPEQRLRKRVRGSALLTPLLPHAQPLKSVFSSLLSLYLLQPIPSNLFHLFCVFSRFLFGPPSPVHHHHRAQSLL